MFAGHPRSIAIHLPDAVKDVLDHNFSGDEYKLAKERRVFCGNGATEPKSLLVTILAQAIHFQGNNFSGAIPSAEGAFCCGLLQAG